MKNSEQARQESIQASVRSNRYMCEKDGVKFALQAVATITSSQEKGGP